MPPLQEWLEVTEEAAQPTGEFCWEQFEGTEPGVEVPRSKRAFWVRYTLWLTDLGCGEPLTLREAKRALGEPLVRR